MLDLLIKTMQCKEWEIISRVLDVVMKPNMNKGVDF